MKGLYIIANIEDAINVAGDGVLMEHQRVDFIYKHKDFAEESLLHLQKKYPDAEFVLFESASIARPANGHPDVLFVEPIA